MKRFNAVKVMQLGTKETKPNPFPGKYPTKILLSVQNNNTGKQLFYYLGKPSQAAVHKFLKIAQSVKKSRTTLQVEFDRKCRLITLMDGKSQGTATLNALYHHWHMQTLDPVLGYTLGYFCNKFWMKKFKGLKTQVYSPHPIINERSRLYFRDWAKKMGYLPVEEKTSEG